MNVIVHPSGEYHVTKTAFDLIPVTHGAYLFVEGNASFNGWYIASIRPQRPFNYWEEIDESQVPLEVRTAVLLLK